MLAELVDQHGYGFEHGPGWYVPIRFAFSEIARLHGPYAIQIFEARTWGGTLHLRSDVYTDDSKRDITAILEHARLASGVICEACGEPGLRRTAKHKTGYDIDLVRCDICFNSKSDRVERTEAYLQRICQLSARERLAVMAAHAEFLSKSNSWL